MAKKILIVEDESGIVKTVSLRLQASGYETISAPDGQEGLEKAKKENPDLIILDLMLPKMDGYKVCALLKNDSRYSKIPIIIFSAKAQENAKVLAAEVKADGYVVKPFRPEELLEMISKLIATQGVKNVESK